MSSQAQRRQAYRRRTSRYSTAKRNRTRHIIKTIMKMRETKHVSHVTTEYDAIPQVGTLINLTQLSQGDSDQARDGDQVYLQKIFSQYVFKYARTATATDPAKPLPAMRMLLVQAKGGSIGLGDMPSFEGPADTDKMYVVRDTLIQMTSGFQYDPSGVGTEAIASGVERYKLNVKNWRNNLLQYDGATVNPVRNAVYLYLVHNSNSDTDLTYAGFSQMYFKEK